MKKAQPSLIADIGYLILKITIIAGVFWLAFTFVFGIFRNTDISMAPSIKDGDLVVFYRLDREFAASDVAVVEWKGKKQARRVVASEGDTVDITEEGLMVNGALLQEEKIYEETRRYEQGIEFPVTLAAGEIFVLGDGRENSTDSRIYGPVKAEDTLGKVTALIRGRGI